MKDTTPKHTLRLAEHCANIRANGLESDVIEYVKYLVLDFLGLATKGLALKSTQQVHGLVREIGGSGDGTVIGTDLKPLPQYAALANASSSHSMSLDDIYTPASIHPGSAILAAALAAGEWQEASGMKIIEAAVAGYETTLRIADAVDSKGHYAMGWHPTATCGTFGATAAVAKLLDLKAKQIANAFGVAGSMASGLMAFMQDGSWTKRIHPGLAAQRGLQAAVLASQGFKGPNEILEGKWGFLSATSNLSNPAKLTEELNGRPRVMDTGLKLHACCRYNQSAIDAVLELRKSHHLSADEIEKIEVELFKAAFPLVVDPWEDKMNPETDVQAQFSLPYTVALAVIKGRVSFEEFNPEVLRDPEVRAVMKKVEVIYNPELDPLFPESWPTKVIVSMTDGNVFDTRVDYPKGDIENPLSWEELADRFKDHTGMIFEESKKDRIVDMITDLQKLENARRLTALLGN